MYFLFFSFILTLSSLLTAESPKITIVGAGLAGLTAAHRLQEKGYPCEVYEARNRAGGRVFTIYFKDGSHEELGGQNIYDGGDGQHMLALIEELGLDTTAHISTYPIFISYDRKISYQLDLFRHAPPADNATLCALEEKLDSVKSLGHLLDAFFAHDPHLRQSLETSMRGWEGSDTSLLSPEYLRSSFWNIYKQNYQRMQIVQQKAALPPRIKRWVKGGNSRLVAALAERVSIHYNMPLKKITRAQDGKIRLDFDGSFVETDYLILAIPCTTLCDIAIENGLFPQDQLFAIHAQQYGTNAKILFPVSSRQALSADVVQTKEGYFFFNDTHDVITWFCGGAPGIFKAEELTAIAKEKLLDLIHLFPQMEFPAGIEPLSPQDRLFVSYERPVGMSWINEPFSKGSYSNYAPGTYAFFHTFITDHGQRVRKPYRSIEGRIFFAGEHTAPEEDNGTMDGAIASGNRAAYMVMHDINNE